MARPRRHLQGAGDHLAFNSGLAQVLNLSPEKLIREVMVFMDDPKGWSLTSGLAPALDGKPGSGPDQRHTLLEMEIREVYWREYRDHL